MGVLCCAAALLGGCSDRAATGFGTQTVTINGKTFELELALDHDSRFQGLSDREHIAPGGGMLFVFPREAEREFVMRRCLVPIDIIFLTGTGRVLSTYAMQIEPAGTPERELRRYASHGPAAFAIELAGGTLPALEVTPGQVIALPHQDLKRRAR